jgi:SAM-dependent methyltransferase
MSGLCTICLGSTIVPVLARRNAPVFQNVVYDDVDAARAAPCGDLDFRRCRSCGFVWNAAFDANLVAYGPGYENRQSLSPSFRAHMASRAKAAMALVPVRPAPTIVDVGCGQGDFLECIDQQPGPGRALFGFDPAWQGEEGERRFGARFSRHLFDKSELGDWGPADLIVSRHVIEHMANPLFFLETLRRAAAPTTRLAIETPDVDWILETGAYHDLFYEHCSLFSLAALDQALWASGFSPTRIERVFDGQYLWAEATVATSRPYVPLSDYIRLWRRFLLDPPLPGPVLVWGAGAKGATFAQMLDPDGLMIRAVIDVNPAKQGRHLAGSGHEVLSPEAATALSPGTVLVMNPAYEAEITAQAEALGWTARIMVVQ